jgi:hypothetical protein
MVLSHIILFIYTPELSSEHAKWLSDYSALAQCPIGDDPVASTAFGAILEW